MDIYTQFAIAIKNVTPEETAWLEERTKHPLDEETGIAPGGALIEGDWNFNDDNATNDLEEIAAACQEFIAQFRPDEVVPGEWAEICSKNQPGNFGGGAFLATSTTVEWMTTGGWLTEKLNSL